jgi:uncharacterized protein YrzB (UPF0473 family)
MPHNQEINHSHEEIRQLYDNSTDSTDSSALSIIKVATGKNYVNYSDDDTSKDEEEAIVICDNILKDSCVKEIDPCDRTGMRGFT